MIDERLRELHHGALLKYMTVAKLKALLGPLPDDALVVPNSMANLSVYDRSVESENMIACVDFASETLRTYREPVGSA